MKLKLICIQVREALSNEAQAGSEVVSEATLNDDRQLGPRPALARLRCAMFPSSRFPRAHQNSEAVLQYEQSWRKLVCTNLIPLLLVLKLS